MKLITTYRNPGYDWYPLATLQRELNRWFDGPPSGAEAGNGGHVWAPVLEVREEENAYVVHAELPGLRKEDIQISLDEGVLTLSGERKQQTKETKEGEVFRTERVYGRFQRAVSLPKPVDATKVTAAHKDGVLTVTLPKTEAAKPRSIDISGN